MRVLILGGSLFLGRALVELALRAGHQVTMLNRGITNPELFPEAERIRADRNGDLSALAARTWDAVIDTSGNTCGAVRRSVAALAGRAGLYAFVSTASVYADLGRPGVPETADTVFAVDGDIGNGGPFESQKRTGEQEVATAFGARSLIIRPGLIVGAQDPSGRFAHWPWRVAEGGQILAPGRPERTLRVIDARDLAGWLLRMVENQTGGVFNASGAQTTMAELLLTCQVVTGASAEFVWMDDGFLLSRGVRPWADLPMWQPEPGPAAGLLQVDCAKAVSQGLAFSPILSTIADVLQNAGSRPRGYLGRTREADLIRDWQANARPFGA